MRGLGRRRVLTAAAAGVALVLLVIGGTLLPTQSATFRTTPAPLVGRTATVCSTAPDPDAAAALSAVAIRRAPGRQGTLAATALDGGNALLSLTEQGRGASVPAPSAPVVLRGEGVMATAGSGMLVSTANTGELGGLMAAPCTPPGTEHWFVGVGADETYRTQIVLSNPDDGQAEVDLRFFGPRGMIVVPGSPGLAVEARSSRVVGLDSLIGAAAEPGGDDALAAGPLTVAVLAGRGRVSAMALNRRSVGLAPAGADWQPSSVVPARSVTVPGVPEGDGDRELVVTNPTDVRAQVSVSVLGIGGPYAPAGAESVDLAPESTATLSLATGLSGQAGAVQLTSDQPVTAAVASRSVRGDAQPDVATQPAVGPMVRTGVVAAASVAGAEAELVLSNGGDADVRLSFEVLSYDGVTLRSDDVLLVGRATATRRLTEPVGSYLVVRVPVDAQVYGGVSFAQPDGLLTGLATVPVTSPDVASRAPRTQPDPSVAR